MPEFLIIAGMSGAGRSTAGATLDDLGWFVIDNMPTALISRVADFITAPGSAKDRVVLIVGRDVEQLSDLSSAVQQLRDHGAVVRILFVDAADEVLIRRFEGTRRRHPAGAQAVTDAIASEREWLEPIRALADMVIDTTDLNVNQLRDRLTEVFTAGSGEPMQVSVVSFGYKHGIPLDVDNVFDIRFLPNPHWVDDLQPLSGLDARVRDYVLGDPDAKQFIEKLDDLFEFLLPHYASEGRSYLTFGIGCTGGRHRSVVLAEELATRIRARGFEPSVFHRDIDR